MSPAAAAAAIAGRGVLITALNRSPSDELRKFGRNCIAPLPLRRISPPLSLSAALPRLSLRSSLLSSPPPVGSSEDKEAPQEEAAVVGFIEVGRISKTHGLKGEIRVAPATDFPELRFCTAGTRWLRSVILGKESIQQVELVSGRQGPNDSWIVSFDNVDSVEKAREIVGSAILVSEDNRPVLEEGEIYSRDLVGMKVFLKENSKLVGTVVKVINFGAPYDHLHVKLDMTSGAVKISAPSNPEEDAPCSYAWVPFVEAIVPDVDINKREMQITPPKGLLELNLHSDSRSKKERSKLEWRERKRFQRHVLAAKKKLSEMGQKHVLEGFSCGKKENKKMLAKQIVDIDYSLLQYASNSLCSCERFNLSGYLESQPMQNVSIKVPGTCLTSPSDEWESEQFKLLTSGIDLVCENKVCMVLAVGENNNQGCEIQSYDTSSGKPTQFSLLKKLLNDTSFLKMHGQRVSAPLIIVSPADDIEDYQLLFSENDYFGLDVGKVRFLREARLPVLSGKTPSKILLRSQWEILESPVGSGGILSALSAKDIMEEIHGWGVDYVQVSGLSGLSVPGHLLLLGSVKSNKRDIGFRICCDKLDQMDDEFDMVLSVQHLKKIAQDPGQVQFHAVAGEREHVELVTGEWRQISPSEPNCICVRSSIYSILNSCSPDRVCILWTD